MIKLYWAMKVKKSSHPRKTIIHFFIRGPLLSWYSIDFYAFGNKRVHPLRLLNRRRNNIVSYNKFDFSPISYSKPIETSEENLLKLIGDKIKIGQRLKSEIVQILKENIDRKN